MAERWCRDVEALASLRAGLRPQHPDWSVGRVFDRQIGLIRGGTRPAAPVHDGKCGANAICATIVGNWGSHLGNLGLSRMGEQDNLARAPQIQFDPLAKDVRL